MKTESSNVRVTSKRLYLLTYIRSWALPEKLPIVQSFRKFPPSNFKEPEGSSPCSQEPSTGPYPEPVRSSPCQKGCSTGNVTDSYSNMLGSNLSCIPTVLTEGFRNFNSVNKQNFKDNIVFRLQLLPSKSFSIHRRHLLRYCLLISSVVK
jgi:hypothetical protein